MSSATKLALPGYGAPLDQRTSITTTFPIAVLDVDRYHGPVLSMREYILMSAIGTITDKDDWHIKVFDDRITAKWQAEMLNVNKPDSPYPNMTVSMAQWAIEEAKYKAELFKKLDFVEGLDGVFKSDTLLVPEIRDALIKAVSKLENVPDKLKDWHPGSDQQVLDLVHPSLCPLIYGRSEILTSGTCGVHDWKNWIGKGEVVPVSARPKVSDDNSTSFSIDYQWLPSEFVLLQESEEVILKSYINNLRPDHHPDLYRIIPKIVSKCIPLWNRVLAYASRDYEITPRISDWHANRGDGTGFSMDDPPEPEWEDNNDDEDDEYYDQIMDEWQDSRTVIPPDAKTFAEPQSRMKDPDSVTRFPCKKPGNAPPRRIYDSDPPIDLRAQHQNLQIIVKLANIHLTPDKPTYAGGKWHVEGQANESICATALYYYSNENTTDSHLSFRQRVDPGFSLPYRQNEHQAMHEIFDLEDDKPCIQDLGSILTRQSRLLAFANIMQHQVQPFSLADRTKPGHRKILALFLVDPNVKIISTENVPPQQQDWWTSVAEESGVLSRLPQELRDYILEHGGAADSLPIARSDAMNIREKLMKERATFVIEGNERYQREAVFSLCEH